MTIENKIAQFEQLQNSPRQAEQAKECFGIVVIIDALGAKSLTIEGAREFLKLRDEVVIDLPFINDTINWAMAEMIASPAETPIDSRQRNILDQLRETKHEVVTFGDSFILLYECKPEVINLALARVAQWCELTVSAAMDRKVFLRGALSIGNYLYGGSQSNTVLGPAVADAASWCEVADWIGVAVTPSAGYYLNQSSINPNELRHHTQFHFFHQQSYIKYSVPLKGGHREELWTLMWPRHFFDHEKPDSIRQRLATIFAGTSMPKGSESKYSNTWDYAEWMWAKSLEWEQQGRSLENSGSTAR